MEKLRPTPARIRELLDYDARAGELTWRVNRRGSAKAGTIAGSRHHSSYIYVRVDGKDYGAHMVAHVLMTGRWPRHEVDHRDLDCANNRWSNIRPATHRQNAQNRSLRADNICRQKGVTQHRAGHRRNKSYEARIRIAGILKSLGYFVTAEAAHAAYCAAAVKHFGKFARAA